MGPTCLGSEVSGNPDKREGDWGQLQGVIGVGDGGQGARAPPPIQEDFFGQLLCKIRTFSGKNHVKFGNFVNFSGKYNKIGYLHNFSGKNHVKFWRFL